MKFLELGMGMVVVFFAIIGIVTFADWLAPQIADWHWLVRVPTGLVPFLAIVIVGYFVGHFGGYWQYRSVRRAR